MFNDFSEKKKPQYRFEKSTSKNENHIFEKLILKDLSNGIRTAYKK